MSCFVFNYTRATSVSHHFTEQHLVAGQVTAAHHRCRSHCYDYGIILFKSKHLKLLPWQTFSSPTFSLLLGCSCSLLKLPSSPGFCCATASWKATQLIECQMWCRPVSWTLKLRGRAWKSFEVRPQKIWACRDVDEQQGKSWFIFLFF